MSKMFKKQGEVQLVNGGYLSDKEENPITNPEFVQAQLSAHRLVTIAERMKGKNFVATEVDSIDALIAEVDAELNSDSVTEFVKVTEAKKGKLTEQLAEEALAFMEDTDKAAFAQKVNSKMQEFKIINEFETFGLFFQKGIVKLNKIYTVKEITKAAKTVYEVLN